MPPAATKPLAFRLLAATGLFLGSMSALYALSVGSMLLDSRDHYIDAQCQAAEEGRPLTAPPGTAKPEDSEALRRRCEKVADAAFSRRGVTLPLDAADFILSILLFLGCASALRGSAWGLSAWSVAAAAAIPVQVLESLDVVLLTRDAAPLLGEPADVSRPLIEMAVVILYFGGSLLYLRRGSIRALFSADEDS